MDHPVLHLVNAIVELSELVRQPLIHPVPGELSDTLRSQIRNITQLWRQTLGISTFHDAHRYQTRHLVFPAYAGLSEFTVDCLCAGSQRNRAADMVIQEELAKSSSEHTLTLELSDSRSSLVGVREVAVRNVDTVVQDETTSTSMFDYKAHILRLIRRLIYSELQQPQTEELLVRRIISMFEADMEIRHVPETRANDAVFVQCYRAALRHVQSAENNEDLTELLLLATQKVQTRSVAIALIRAYKRCQGVSLLWSSHQVQSIQDKIVQLVTSCLPEDTGFLLKQLILEELNSKCVFEILQPSSYRDLRRDLDTEELLYDRVRASPRRVVSERVPRTPTQWSSPRFERQPIVPSPVFDTPVHQRADHSPVRTRVSPVRQYRVASLPTQSYDQDEDFLPLLHRIVDRYCSADRAVKPERWFPMLFKLYIKILKENNPNVVLETDPFYREVKAAVSKWKHHSIGHDSFSVDLSGLFRVFRGETDSAFGDLRPTLEMRYTWIRFHNEMELKRKYLALWYTEAKDEDVSREMVANWETYYARKCFAKWKSRYIKISRQNVRALAGRETVLKMVYLDKWKTGYENHLWLKKGSDDQIKRKFLAKWVRRYETIQTTTKNAMAVYNAKLVAKPLFDVWKLSAPSRTKPMAAISNRLTKKSVFGLMKTTMAKVQEAQELSDRVHDELLVRSVFRAWLKSSADSVEDVDELLLRERNFVVASALFKWKNALSLRICEKEAVYVNNEILLKWVMKKWKRCHELRELGSELVAQQDHQLLRSYFKKYLRVTRMTTMARELREKQLLETSLHRWKTQSEVSKLQARIEIRLLNKSLRLWKLRYVLEPQLKKDSQRLKLVFLGRWMAKAVQSRDASEKAEQYATKLYLKKYFVHLKAVKTRHRADVRKAERFYRHQQQWRAEDLMVSIYAMWREATRAKLEKQKELERRFAEFGNTSENLAREVLERWRSKYAALEENQVRADVFCRIVVTNKHFNHILDKWNRILELQVEESRIVEENDARRQLTVMRLWNLRMLQLRRGAQTAEEFKKRWDRHSLRRHFDIWVSSKQQAANRKLSPERAVEDNPFAVSVSPLGRRPRLSPLRLGPVEALKSPDNESVLRTPSKQRFHPTVPASERIRKMKTHETKMHYQKVKRDSPEKLGNTSPPKLTADDSQEDMSSPTPEARAQRSTDDRTSPLKKLDYSSSPTLVLEDVPSTPQIAQQDERPPGSVTAITNRIMALRFAK